MSNVSHLPLQDLQSAIAHDFLTITSDQSVRSAITMMGGKGDSCVLVVRRSESDCPELTSHDLMGIVTERDIIHASLQSIPLEQISVQTVMSQPVITIAKERLDDLQAVILLFHQHHLLHLLVLDGDRVVGILDKNQLTDVLAQSFLDYGEIRKIESSRQPSDLQSSALAAAAPVAIFKFDEIFHCTYVNDRWSEMTGRPKESALGHGWMDSLHPDDRDACLAQWRQDYAQANFNDRVILYSEGRHLRPDGSTNWFYVQVVQEIDIDNNVVGYVGTLTDITSRKQAEIALQKSEQRYRALMDGASDAIFLSDTHGYGITANQQAEILLGYSHDEIKNLHMSLIHPPESLEAVRAQFTQIVLNKSATNLETLVVRKDGSLIPVDITARLIELEGEQIVQAIFRDISARKNIEEELAKSEAKFRRLVEGANDLIWSADQDGVFTYLSPQFKDIFGWEPSEWIGQSAFELVHPEDLPSLDEYIQNSRNGQRSTKAEFRHLHQNGLYIWVKVHTTSILDYQGKVIGYQGVLTDINDRKNSEEALRLSEEMFRSAFNITTIGMSLASADGKFLKVNAAICNFLGYSETELLQLSFQDITHPDDLPQSVELARKLIAGEIENDSFEKRYYNKQGQVVWGFVGIAIVRDTHKQPLYLVAQIQDISDRKQTEIQLQNISARLEVALQSARIGIWEWDVVTGDLIWDERMYEFYGVNPAKKITGEAWMNGIHPDDLSKALEDSRQALAGEKEYNSEFRVLLPDGSSRYLQAHAIVQRDAKDNPLRMIGVNYDITPQKQAELKLRESEIRFRRVFESSVVGMLFADFQGHILEANDRFLEMIGYTREELISGAIHWDDLTPPEHIANDLIAIENLQKHGVMIPWEKEYYRKDGGRVAVLIGVALLPDTNDQTICIVMDISDRKHAEKILSQYTYEVEDLYNNAPCGYHSLDPNGRYIRVNETELQWLGYQREEMIGQPLIKFLTEDSCQAFFRTYEVFLERGMIKNAEFEMICKDGTILPVMINSTAVKDEHGNYLYGRTTMVDIRDRKQYEQRLEKTNAELIRATQLKNEFLATMSHELRTPLNAILGMTESLKEQIFGMVNERQFQALQTVERSGMHLLELINDILDVAKIEAGQIALNYAPTSISYLCQSSLAFIRQQANHKNIKIDVQIPTLYSDVLVDERRMRQVLINLLNNAVKFTPEGGNVTLAVRRKANQESAKPTSWIHFAVADTGIGIPQDKIPKLFQPFMQIDSSLNRKYTGTGLGLALVKRIVELHGGKVQLTSEVDVGSCFDIFIPYIPAPSNHRLSDGTTQPEIYFESNEGSQPEIGSETISDNLEIAPKPSPTILIVEDNEANINTLANYLEAKGYQLLLARDGLAAITMATNHRPDLILMDIQMPVMDGLESTKQIRRNPELSNIPIIALTALAMPDDREKCIEAGANDYITKPVKLKQLHILIQQLLTSAWDNVR